MKLFERLAGIDWLLILFVLPITIGGLFSMKGFVGGGTDVAGLSLFGKQLVWVCVGLIVFYVVSNFEISFFKRTDVLVGIFGITMFLLLVLFGLGHVAKGAQSWFSLGGFSFQPSDFAKFIVILVLAKYFSRRHIEIAQTKHLFISMVYAGVPFILVFLQPDFGSAIIILFIWFGMVLVSGIPKKQIIALALIGLVAFGILWTSVFKPYQKARIVNFIHPLSDISGSGYNVYQSIIAVGSGQVVGKGVGFGTQSRLKFLPEYQTDFIFSAFAEEWGFVGALILFLCYFLLMLRISQTALLGVGNFEFLVLVGIACLFMSHIIINIGMNIGLMPVTGITLPFMSYGGSHLIMEFTALGIISSIRRTARIAHPHDLHREFLGL